VAERSLMSFATLLRKLRAEAGLTQEELAEMAALSVRSVSDLERGVSVTARKETARLLADALNLSGPSRAMFDAAARGIAASDSRASTGEAPAAAASLPVSEVAAVHALPRDAANFTGRVPELDQLMSELENALDEEGSGRVVGVHAIDGMAGIGKTTFAVHAAHLLSPRFPDGQFFLPLHSHTPGQRPADPAAALGTLLLTTGIAAKEIPDGLDARTMMWRNGIADKRVLLVLDDAASHEQVRPLLPGTPGSLVLITSRRRLAALEEAIPISLDMLSPDEAAELFSRLTGRSDCESEAVAEITQLCGYLPLAIRLIAGTLRRHPSWTVPDLAAELAAAKDRLAAMRAENLSVAAAFDLSYQPLAPAQQRLFRKLGLHPGTSIDIYATAALDGTSLAAARRNLDDLYDHHLITEPARGRYRLHDLLRQHARALAESDDATDREQAVGRLLDYYLHTAAAANRLTARRPPSGSPGITSPPVETPYWHDGDQATAWLEAELANLQACAEYAAAHDQPVHAVWIPAQLGEFLHTWGYRDQALAMHRSAAAIADAVGDRAGHAVSLANLGNTEYLAADYPAAKASLTEAITLHRELGNHLGLADALLRLGLVLCLLDRYVLSQEALTETLSLFRELGDKSGQAQALDYLGFLQYSSGEYRASGASLEEALALFRKVGDQRGQAEVLCDMGRLQNYTGDYDSAIQSLTRSLNMHRELGSRRDQAMTLNHLGIAQRLTGAYEAASSSLAQALHLSTQIGDQHHRGGVLLDLGSLCLATGDYAKAADCLTQALELLNHIGDRQGQAETLNCMGDLLAETDGPAAGLIRYVDALVIAREIGDILDKANALAGIGRCHLQAGDIEVGVDHLRQALRIYQKIGSPGAERVRQTLAEYGEVDDTGDQSG
jgi:tetratricopeptide (TPR) repeat protein/transcriptional regulator with XRE-family HTH domain